MQEFKVKCPCCGRCFILSIVVEDTAAGAVDQSDMARIASELGIECGALKGGEEIGD